MPSVKINKNKNKIINPSRILTHKYMTKIQMNARIEPMNIKVLWLY